MLGTVGRQGVETLRPIRIMKVGLFGSKGLSCSLNSLIDLRDPGCRRSENDG